MLLEITSIQSISINSIILFPYIIVFFQLSVPPWWCFRCSNVILIHPSCSLLTLVNGRFRYRSYRFAAGLYSVIIFVMLFSFFLGTRENNTYWCRPCSCECVVTVFFLDTGRRADPALDLLSLPTFPSLPPVRRFRCLRLLFTGSAAQILCCILEESTLSSHATRFAVITGY